jgi:hypothetical protein
MRQRLYVALALFLFVLGFFPNVGVKPTTFTVPPGAKPTSFRGLPPGNYTSRSLAWYVIGVGIVTNDQNQIVEITNEIAAP